jgi:hypothetical protein
MFPRKEKLWCEERVDKFMIMYEVSQFGNEDSSKLNPLQLDFKGVPQNPEKPLRNKHFIICTHPQISLGKPNQEE